MADIAQMTLKDTNGTVIGTYSVKDATARNRLEDTTQTGALYHLGFYLDENGGLCQVNSI